MTIYHVEAQHENSNSSIGYFTGTEQDIRVYCGANHNIGYGLIIKPITIKAIPAGTAMKIELLLQQEREIKNNLIGIQRRIKELT